MSNHRFAMIGLLVAAGLLFPGAGFAAATNDAPISTEALEKAQGLIEAASKIKARHTAEAAARRRQAATQQDDLQSVAGKAGFQKFLKIKNLGIEKNSDGNGLVLLEGSRKSAGGPVFDLLLSNFSRWDSAEAAIRKADSSCLGPGDYCSSSMWCCGAMSCRGGVCSGAGSSCIPRGRPCSSSIWCCGTGICSERGYCQ